MGQGQPPHSPPPKIITARCSQPLEPRQGCGGKDGDPHCPGPLSSPGQPVPIADGSLSCKGRSPAPRLILEQLFLEKVSSPSWEGSVPEVMVEKSRIRQVPGQGRVARGCAGSPRAWRSQGDAATSSLRARSSQEGWWPFIAFQTPQSAELPCTAPPWHGGTRTCPAGCWAGAKLPSLGAPPGKQEQKQCDTSP